MTKRNIIVTLMLMAVFNCHAYASSASTSKNVGISFTNCTHDTFNIATYAIGTTDCANSTNYDLSNVTFTSGTSVSAIQEQLLATTVALEVERLSLTIHSPL